jgi:hypothetical protein
MDFNLQIPANALTLAAILGIGYKAACLEPRTDGAGTRFVASSVASYAAPGRGLIPPKARSN